MGVVEIIFRKSVNNNNKNMEIETYFKELESPSINRENDKYYVEMQLLAFQLMRYLKMNNHGEEHSCQGNYNWTYFRENLSDKDWKLLVRKILGDMNTHDWEDAIVYWKDNKEEKKRFLNMIKDDAENNLVMIKYREKGCQHDESRIVREQDLKEVVSHIFSHTDIEYLETKEADMTKQLFG